MKFNSLWSAPFKFNPYSDDWSILEELGGKDCAGVYLIRDNQDRKNLYLGKAENTSKDIYKRLKDHMSAKGNKKIAERVENQETFTIRWIESNNPSLTESALLIGLNASSALSTDDNCRIEWQDKYSLEQVIAEAERIGIGTYSQEKMVSNLMSALYPEKIEELKRSFDKSGNKVVEPSIDKKIHQNKEQQYAEGHGENPQPRPSSIRSSNGDQLDRINSALSKSYPKAAKDVLWKKRQELTGISFEDTQALLQQLQRFQNAIGNDWRGIVSQWQNLQSCWQDRQYDRFEPFFEQLCRTYDQCEQRCEEYTQFLEERIRASEDTASTFNI